MPQKPAGDHHLRAQDHPQGARAVQAAAQGSQAGGTGANNEEENIRKLHLLEHCLTASLRSSRVPQSKNRQKNSLPSADLRRHELRFDVEVLLILHLIMPKRGAKKHSKAARGKHNTLLSDHINSKLFVSYSI